MPLSDLLTRRRPDNAKAHDIATIDEMMETHGWRGAILMDEASGKIQAGHGRLKTLENRREAGEAAPEGVEVRDGEWYVPVIRGESWDTEALASAYVVGDNETTIAGGWDNAKLLDVLRGQMETRGTLAGTGFDVDRLEELQRVVAGQAEEGGGDGEPPDGFKEYDDDIPTEHTCPNCGFQFSGGGSEE